MADCQKCGSQIPAGSRWCAVCHSSAVGIKGELASPGKRFGAHMLDVMIPVTALFMMLGIAGLSKSLGIGFLLLMGYGIWALMLFSNGTTPGKKLLGMRVIKENGDSAHFGTMFLREVIGKAISGMIFALGFIWIFLDRDRQGWHDKIASTYVVQ